MPKWVGNVSPTLLFFLYGLPEVGYLFPQFFQLVNEFPHKAGHGLHVSAFKYCHGYGSFMSTIEYLIRGCPRLSCKAVGNLIHNEGRNPLGEVGIRIG